MEIYDKDGLSFAVKPGITFPTGNKSSNTAPAFILGGLIYSIFEDLDIDLGLKVGLNKPETDYSIVAGVALRF